MKRLFLDLDGVLVNWNKGAHEVHGLPYEQGKWPYKFGPDGWCWNDQLETPMPTEKLFAPMDRKFWANLEWLPDGKRILSVCESKFGRNICLLTSPWQADGVIDGRMDWIKKHMPSYMKRVLVGPCKEACAHGEAVLVDDCQANIIKWQDHEGIGVMVPRPHNSRYKMRHIAADEVEARLHSIMNGKGAEN